MVKSASIALLLMTQIVSAVDKAPLYSWYKGVNPEDVVYAINCGAEEESVDQNGIKYFADRGFTGGVSSNEGGN